MSRQEMVSHPGDPIRSPREEARHLMENTTVAPVDTPAFRRRLAEILTRAVKKVYRKGHTGPKHRNR